MFAIVLTGGKQYYISEKKLIEVEKINGKCGDIIELKNVLMIFNNKEILAVGHPFILESIVKAKIIKHFSSTKTISFKKRRRKNSQRIKGNRQKLTNLLIENIIINKNGINHGT